MATDSERAIKELARQIHKLSQVVELLAKKQGNSKDRQRVQEVKRDISKYR